jgi:hypothetical protein
MQTLIGEWTQTTPLQSYSIFKNLAYVTIKGQAHQESIAIVKNLKHTAGRDTRNLTRGTIEQHRSSARKYGKEVPHSLGVKHSALGPR